MDSTWEARELPVLDAVVRFLDERGLGEFPQVTDIAEMTGLDKMTVARALNALDGEYVDFQKMISGGDPSGWFVRQISSDARRVVGQWPTAEGLVDRFVAALESAADNETSEERRSKIRQVSNALGGALRDVAVEVAGSVVARGAGF